MMLRRGKLQEGVEDAAFFEGTRALLVIEFAEDAGPGEFGKGNRFEASCDHCAINNTARSRTDRRKSNRHVRQLSCHNSQVGKKRGGSS